MKKIVEFTYQKGLSEFIDHLVDNNQLNLVKQMLLSNRIDRELVKEIESTLETNSDNIITLIEGNNITTLGYVKILQQYEKITTDPFKIYFSKEKSVPMLFIQDKEHELTALMFSWENLASLLKPFDYKDLFAL